MAQALGLLPSTGEIQMQSQAPDLGLCQPALALAGIWGMNNQAEDVFPFNFAFINALV